MQSNKQILTRLIETLYKSRKVLLALSCLVVFIVTYVLILPAFTLEKDEAAELGGIDVQALSRLMMQTVLQMLRPSRFLQRSRRRRGPKKP